MPDAPEDPLDEARALAKVWQGLFGGGTEAPRVDQYYLLRELGAGAMGVVYSAFDPKLQRHVALKLLHARRGSPAESDRMLREARALAKISHPNVVGVYAVGSGPRGAYIAMEYVEGQTLARWLREQGTPRPWREVVSQFIAVGRGLAAAHDAGIVHRDFKPANVLVGDDGVVRVADFGLAAEARREPPAEGMTTAESSSTRETVTKIGTPAYMAPEQRDGAEPTPAADQYAYFVSLHEGLFGTRPDHAEAPTRPGIRPAILRVLARGLADDPAQRYPSMHAAVDALRTAANPSRWCRFIPWTVAGASIATAVVVAASSAATPPEVAAAQPCSADDDATASLREAAESGGDPALTTALHSYADAWTDADREVCLAHERGEESDALFDARKECLTRQRRAATAIADILGGSVPLDIRERLVAGLPPVDECRVPGSLLTGLRRPEDPDARARGEQLMIAVQEQFVRLDAGLPASEPAVAEIRAATAEIEDHAARGQAERFLSRLETDLEGQRRRLVSAVTEAIVSHDPALVVVAQLELSHAQLMGNDVEAARETLAFARAANDNLAALDPAYEETATWYRGAIAAEWAHHARLQGDSEAALEAARQTADAWLHFVDTSPVWVAVSLNNVGEGLRLVGRPAEAVEYYDRAEALARRRLDARDPSIVTIHSNRGAARIDAGDLAGGARDLTQALSLLDDDAWYPNALLQFNLGAVAAIREDHETAQAHYRAAKAVFAAHDDPESRINAVLARMGIAGSERDASVASHDLRVVYEDLAKQVAAPHPRLAEVLVEWARAEHRAGNDDDARARASEAVRMLDDAGIDSGVERARALIVFAHLQAGTAAPDEQAGPRVARAIEILEAAGRDHPLLADAWVTKAELRPDDPQRDEWLDRATTLVELHELGPRLRARIADAKEDGHG